MCIGMYYFTTILKKKKNVCDISSLLSPKLSLQRCFRRRELRLAIVTATVNASWIYTWRVSTVARYYRRGTATLLRHLCCYWPHWLATLITLYTRGRRSATDRSRDWRPVRTMRPSVLYPCKCARMTCIVCVCVCVCCFAARVCVRLQWRQRGGRAPARARRSAT